MRYPDTPRTVQDLLSEASRLKLSRRSALKRAAALGLSVSAVGAALPATAGRTAAQGKTQIRLGTWAAVEEATELQAVLDRVNAEATDFEIVSEPQPSDYLVKMQTTLAGGTAPELFWLSQENVAGFAALGALLDLTDRLAADQTPAAKTDDYFAPILDTARYQEKTFGLPWISQPVMLYYNPALFQAAGVAEPDDTWTWDTFMSAAEQLTDPATGVYGTSFNSWPPIHMFIWQAGGETTTDDLSASPIDSPEAITGANFYASVVYNEAVAVPEATITDQGFAEMAKAGKVAMFYGGASDDLDFAHTVDPANAVMKTALVPMGPQNRTTFAWTASTVANAKAANPDLAYKALVALTEGIHHWKVVAPRQSLANAETITSSLPGKAGSAETILKALPDMRSFNVIPQQAEWDAIFLDEYQVPLFHDEGTAEELAPEIRPLLEELLP